MYLDFQQIIAEIEERKAISPSLEEKKRFSIIQEKMRVIVSGSHCEGGRKLERIKKILSPPPDQGWADGFKKARKTLEEGKMPAPAVK